MLTPLLFPPSLFLYHRLPGKKMLEVLQENIGFALFISLTLFLADHARWDAQPPPGLSLSRRVFHDVRPNVVGLNDDGGGRTGGVCSKSFRRKSADSTVYDKQAFPSKSTHERVQHKH